MGGSAHHLRLILLVHFSFSTIPPICYLDRSVTLLFSTTVWCSHSSFLGVASRPILRSAAILGFFPPQKMDAFVAFAVYYYDEIDFLSAIKIYSLYLSCTCSSVLKTQLPHYDYHRATAIALIDAQNYFDTTTVIVATTAIDPVISVAIAPVISVAIAVDFNCVSDV